MIKATRIKNALFTWGKQSFLKVVKYTSFNAVKGFDF